MTTPESSDAPQLQEYHGNCHCGAFRFTIKIPPLKHVKTCDCSICVRNGYMWIFPILDGHLLIKKGEEILKEYEFGKRETTHMFCPICGTSVMGRRKKAPKGRAIGINARTLTDINLDAIEVESFNGADLDPPYQPPQPPSKFNEVEDGLKVYCGNCHCGTVAYTVKTRPLSEIEVMCCNCSLCSRNGDLWIYPKKAAVHLHGAEALTEYVFLHEDSLHCFCSMCGVSVIVRVLKNGEDNDICPLNVRTINGIQLDELRLKKYDGRKNDPQYVLRN